MNLFWFALSVRCTSKCVFVNASKQYFLILLFLRLTSPYKLIRTVDWLEFRIIEEAFKKSQHSHIILGNYSLNYLVKLRNRLTDSEKFMASASQTVALMGARKLFTKFWQPSPHAENYSTLNYSHRSRYTYPYEPTIS